MRTTVGSKRAAFSTASSPFARLRDHLDVLLAGEQHAEAGPDEGLVVGDEDADRHAAWSAIGRRAPRTNPPSGAGSRTHLTAVDLHSLAYPDEAVAPAVALHRTASVVAHLDPQLFGCVAYGHVRADSHART